MGSIRAFLTSLEYGDNYVILWVVASILFIGISTGPAFMYILFYADIDKSVKTALRGPSSRDRDPEDPEAAPTRRVSKRRRKKKLVSRRFLIVHAPAILGLLALGTSVAFGLTALLSST